MSHAMLEAEVLRLRAALRRIWFLDHNEREWESVEEVKAFAKSVYEERCPCTKFCLGGHSGCVSGLEKP